jgi:8-amino-7-oxononanoate synthase
VPGLEDHRRDLIALDQQPALVVGGEVHRAEHSLPPPLAKPRGGGVDQCVGDRAVVHAFEETEHPVASALVFVPALVDVGADPPHHLPVALAEEVLGLGMVEERVLGPVQKAPALGEKRGHPLLGVAVELERKLDEAVEVSPASDRPDREIPGAGRLLAGRRRHGANLANRGCGGPRPLGLASAPRPARLPPMTETTRAPTDVFEKARTHDRIEILQAAREADLVPYFRLLESEAGPVVEMEGAEKIMLGSNNYLGLTSDPRVKAAAEDALERYGTGLTGSRFLNGTIPLHIELEREIAEWMGTEEAIVFTTGYAANLGTIGTILEPGDTVVCDSGDHASILDGCRLSGARLRPYRHNRMDKLERMLERAAEDGGGVLVVVDGVFSMEGDICDLPTIVELCGRYGARLMVDEAHAAGALGARGAGTCELFGLEDRVDLRMGTFSKSLASCGGFIAGPSEVVEFLRYSSRAFMFTASAVPAAIGAALASLRIIRAEGGPLFERLLDNAAYLHRGLTELGLKVVEPTRMPDGTEALTPIVPVVVGEDWQAALLWRALFDAGVYTNVALHPAVPPGGALLRTSLMATHEREHLDRALEIFAEVTARFPDLPRL